VLDADGVPVPVTADGSGLPTVAGTEVLAVPVSLTDRSTGASSSVLVFIALMVLGAVTLLPPMLSRRLRESTSR